MPAEDRGLQSFTCGVGFGVRQQTNMHRHRSRLDVPWPPVAILASAQNIWLECWFEMYGPNSCWYLRWV